MCGLKPFLALGKLDLSGNSLSWSELSHIRHMAILDLTLCGNPQLESQPWCKYDVFMHLTSELLHSLVLVCAFCYICVN